MPFRPRMSPPMPRLSTPPHGRWCHKLRMRTPDRLGTKPHPVRQTRRIGRCPPFGTRPPLTWRDPCIHPWPARRSEPDPVLPFHCSVHGPLLCRAADRLRQGLPHCLPKHRKPWLSVSLASPWAAGRRGWLLAPLRHRRRRPLPQGRLFPAPLASRASLSAAPAGLLPLDQCLHRSRSSARSRR